jgi:hypothetical protein
VKESEAMKAALWIVAGAISLVLGCILLEAIVSGRGANAFGMKPRAVGESVPNNRKTQWIVLNPNLFGSPLTVSFETNTWDVFVTNDFQGAAILFKRKEEK